MGLPFIKLQQHTLNHGSTNSLELEGRVRERRRSGRVREVQRAGAAEGRGVSGERERHMRNGGNAAPWIHNIQGAFLKRVQALPTFQVWSIHT